MILRSFIVLIFLMFSFQAFSDCHIELNEKVYLLEKLELLSLKTVIKKSTCTGQTGKLLKELLHDRDGKIKTIYLQKLLSKEMNQTVKVTPENIQIENLEKFIQKKFHLKENQNFTQIKLIGRKKSLILSSDEILKTLNETKLRMGRQSLSLAIINIISGLEKRIWIKGNLTSKVKVLTAKEDLQAGLVTLNNFNWELISSICFITNC